LSCAEIRPLSAVCGVHVLDGLDRVDWRRLRHAFGTAEDVPALIRSLTSQSPDERQAALSELHGNIWHQGTVYEATPHAVPFLIELAASVETPDRCAILSYLGTLADGSSYIQVHGGGQTLSAQEVSAQLAVEVSWVAATRRAVKSGAALYLETLRAHEHDICCAAAYVLSRFPEEAERYWAPLRERYEAAESDDLARCGIAILTKDFSARGTSDTQWLLRMFDKEKHSSVRVALAVSVALSNKQRVDDALQCLVTHLLTDDQVEQGYHAQPWDSGEAVWDIIRALCASKRGRRMLVDRFNQLFFQGAPRDRLDYVRYVLSGEVKEGNISGVFAQPMGLLTIPNEELDTAQASGQLSLDL